jgi:hypothetical protein
MEPMNRFQGINSASLCSLAGRYDVPIPTRCLAPIDLSKNSSSVLVPWRELIGRATKGIVSQDEYILKVMKIGTELFG